MIYQKYSDPAHGWLRVPITELAKLGIAEEISNYSYRSGRYAYLEEDGDLTKFYQAYIDHYNLAPVIQYNHTNNRSRIRNYPMYQP